MKKTVRRMVSVITIMAIVLTALVSAFPASAGSDSIYHSVRYTAGTTDNVVGSTTFNLACVEGAKFEFANSKRFSRKGYKLTSWYIRTTNQIVGCESTYTMPSYDLDVEAVWTPAVYTVGFAGVGGVTANGDKNIYIDATYGTAVTLPQNPFTKDGYTFQGWEYAGVTYAAGSEFEIPAVLTGSKIVLAAKWADASAAVTTATTPEVTTTTTTTTTMMTTTEETTTETTTEATTTTTTALAPNQKVKKFKANYEFMAANEIFKAHLYDVIDNGDIVDSLKFNFSTEAGTMGTVSLTINTMLKDGTTCEKSFVGEVEGRKLTIDLADTAACNLMGFAKAIQVGVWYSTSYPLSLDSITAVVREPEVTTTTTEEITTTTTTTTTTEATTTTTEETTTTTTTTFAETTTSTTPFVFAVADEETTTTEANGRTFTREIAVNETVEMGSIFTMNASALVNKMDTIESLEVTFNANGRIGSYNVGAFMNMADTSVFQRTVSGQTDEAQTVVTVNVDNAGLMNADSMVSIGYWFGESDSITIETIKVNYRVDKGDFDNDGVITANDVNLLKQALVGKVQLDSSLDIDGNGTVNVFDSIVLQRMI